MRLDETPVDPRIQEVAAAVALAGHYFPRQRADGSLFVRMDDVLFLLSGQLGVWSRWPTLPRDEQVLITKLLRYRDSDLANGTVVRTVLERSRSASWPGVQIPEEGPIEELGLTYGASPLAMAREGIALLGLERGLDTRRSTPVALSGPFGSPLFSGPRSGRRLVANVGYELNLAEPIETVPVDIGEPVVDEKITFSLAELRAIADKLDAEYGKTYWRESLEKIFGNLNWRTGHDVASSWNLTAGMTQILHAPTGFGKSVLAEIVACWCAQQGRVMTILVSANAGVIKTAHTISGHLEALGLEGQRAVALTSPNSAQVAAETAAAGDLSDSGRGQWAMKTMGYGCALSAAAVADRDVDAWEPGQEPCSSLLPIDGTRSGAQRHSCPWMPTCGKYRNVRAACSAPVVVTTFSNWLTGVVHVPVLARGQIRRGMAVEELLLHRSDLILIDEVDEFQTTMIKGQASKIVLAHNRLEETPLRRIWAELPTARRGINGAIRGDARSATNLAMELAEGYVGHLAEGDFHRVPKGRSKHHPLLGRWMLPKKWDGLLTATLFNLAEGQQVTAEQYQTFRALFELDPAVELPEWLRPIQVALAMIQVNSGTDPLEQARTLIEDALARSPHERLRDNLERSRTVDRLIRRAYFGALRDLLTTFIYLGPNLTAAGVTSASEISDKLRRYKEWRAAPLGPLGRTLFAFSEVYDPDRADDAALSVNAFGGDPHTYVPTIGETTALAYLGTKRCVLGLSATSYFPGAPHHHIFLEPTWWVPDSSTGGFTLRATPVTDENREFIRLSGTSGQERREAMVNLGRHMWIKQLEPELRLLASNPETRKRQRILLATTSYEGAEDLARGLAGAGVGHKDIVLAVRPTDDAAHASNAPWQALAADQLERFAQDIDGKILIAPLARAARGINMADDDGKSLVGSVWLVVRPVPIIDEPAEILAHVHAATKAATAPSDDPGTALAIVKRSAAQQLDELFNTLPFFSHLPQETRRSITAETLVGLIQLAGRTRRGGTHGRIHLIDAAFHQAPRGSDLPHLIQELRREWERDHLRPLPLLESLYGDTLSAIFDFADERVRNADDRFDDHEQ